MRLLGVARLVPKKGIEVLLEALAALPPELHWRYEHVGGGPLRDALAALGRAPRSCRARRVARRPAAGSRCWTPIAPPICSCWRTGSRRTAIRDGLPNVLLEAGALELPVVASRIGAVPELIEDGVNGRLVPPDDPPALAGALAALIRDPAARLRCGRAGRRRVLDQFAMEPGLDRLAARLCAAARARRADRGMSGPVAFYARSSRPTTRSRRATGAWRAPDRGAALGRWLRSSWRAACAATIARAIPRGSARSGRLGDRVAAQLLRRYRRTPAARRPRAWLTYHAYHKSPDWLGPRVTAALGIPYLLAEASFAPKQREGPGPTATPPPNRRSAPPTWCSR